MYYSKYIKFFLSFLSFFLPSPIHLRFKMSRWKLHRLHDVGNFSFENSRMFHDLLCTWSPVLQTKLIWIIWIRTRWGYNAILKMSLHNFSAFSIVFGEYYETLRALWDGNTISPKLSCFTPTREYFICVL